MEKKKEKINKPDEKSFTDIAKILKNQTVMNISTALKKEKKFILN